MPLNSVHEGILREGARRGAARRWNVDHDDVRDITRYNIEKTQRYRQNPITPSSEVCPIYFLSLNPSGLADAARGHWLPCHIARAIVSSGVQDTMHDAVAVGVSDIERASGKSVRAK